MPSFADANSVLSGFVPTDSEEEPKTKPTGRGLSAPTASRKFKDARQLFHYGVKKKLISENPFEGMKIPPQDNPDRLVEITRQVIEQLLKQIEEPELRLIVVLARFAGLRVPSEISTLRWRDVDGENKTLHVFTPKTEHHSRGGRRVCPLFPELISYFDAVRPSDGNPDAYVIKKHRGSALNLRTALDRKMSAAGLVRWPKLFQNLRANSLTDLAESHPIHTVCQWLGNTVEVAMRHYLVIKQRENAGPGSGAGRGDNWCRFTFTRQIRNADNCKPEDQLPLAKLHLCFWPASMMIWLIQTISYAIPFHQRPYRVR